MRVAEVIVHNYKSICSEVGECRLNLDEKITYLIGANESGKTNLLEVMEKFSLGGFQKKDIPYKSSSSGKPDIPDNLNMVSVKYAIEEQDTDTISNIGTPLIEVKEITLTRNFKGEPYISYPDYKGKTELEDALAHLQRDCQQFADIFREYVKEYKRINRDSASSTNSALRRLTSLLNQIDSLTQSFDKPKITVARTKVGRLRKAIMNLADPLESRDSRILKPLEQITMVLKKLPTYYTIENLSEKLWELVPQFALVPADHVLWLKGQYLVNDIINQPQDNKKLTSIRRLLHLSELKLADTRRLDDVQQTVALERASEKITMLLRAVWRQEKEIEIKFQWAGEGNRKLLVMVQSDGHRGYPEDRSLGFRWFLEFYLMYATALHRNLVLLFEEPGIHLNPRAQEDLKHIMRDKVAAESQIVYTTHLPGMYDAAYPEGCRAVQKEGGVTKIETQYSPKHQYSTWEVAIRALGVTEPLIRMSNKNIITEGPADWVYLLTFARLFASDEPLLGEIASGLIHIHPAKKASAVPGIIPFFFQEGVESVILLDNDQPGRSAKAKLEQQYHLPDNKYILDIVMTNDSDSGDHEFENLFGVKYYAKLVTSWLGKGKLTEKDFNNKKPLSTQAETLVKQKFNKDLNAWDLAWHFHDLIKHGEELPEGVKKRFKELLVKLVSKFNRPKDETQQGTDAP